MAGITPQEIDLDGIDPTFSTASSGGDTIENAEERTMVRVINAAGTARTVTIEAQNNCNHGFTHDIVLVTANGDDITTGAFDKERFNDANGDLVITYSSEVGITLAGLILSKAP